LRIRDGSTCAIKENQEKESKIRKNQEKTGKNGNPGIADLVSLPVDNRIRIFL